MGRRGVDPAATRASRERIQGQRYVRSLWWDSFHIRRILCLVLALGLCMSSYGDLFESSVLSVIGPPPSLEFPSEYTGQKASDWIARLREPLADRKTAFFGMYAAFL